jgi:transmembrane sensor
MKDQSRLEYLMEQYFSNRCSAAERQELFRLIDEGEQDEAVKAWMDASWPRISAHYRLDDSASDQILVAILGEAATPVVPMEDVEQRGRRRWMGWAAAAVILLIAGGAVYYFAANKTPEKPTIASGSYKGDVLPGHSGAVLHLADGATVVLDSARNGTVARQGTVEAVKVNGELKYVGTASDVVYNTVTTARGRQWQLTLPDGTKVWLNASSSIHYPLAFTGKDRVVEMTGEAYFEVAHNAEQPFRVKVGDQVIEDVGTAFNVNAYTDEPAMRTTLAEGAVRVGGATLEPGQQAIIVGDRVRVSVANVGQALAWKNGFFSFDKADINTVMRQLSRWYDVEVKFQGVPDTTPFEGEIGRGLTLAQVLKGLEQIHVHFRIEEDKRIVILP